MKGGMRYGAGRPGWRRRCEQVPRIDLREFRRRSLIRQGAFTWSWNKDGDPCGSVSVRFGEGLAWLHLSYTHNGKRVEDAFALEHRPCRFGGQRHFIVCSRCRKRSLVLYGVSRDGRFACRSCLRLGYLCESMSLADRAQRKADKLEAKLAEDWERPTGMRRRTYERLLDQLTKATERADALSLTRIEALLARLDDLTH